MKLEDWLNLYQKDRTGAIAYVLNNRSELVYMAQNLGVEVPPPQRATARLLDHLCAAADEALSIVRVEYDIDPEAIKAACNMAGVDYPADLKAFIEAHGSRLLIEARNAIDEELRRLMIDFMDTAN